MCTNRGRTGISKRFFNFLGALCALGVASQAHAAPACAPAWVQPARSSDSDLLSLLKAVAPGTTWANVPVDTKARLQVSAKKRQASFRLNWNSDALTQKEVALLGCPTPEMVAAVDDYYRKSFDTIIPPTFALAGVSNSALRRALTRNYLASLAAFRTTLTYGGKLPNRDWDGVSRFDSIRMPDDGAFQDIRSYASDVVKELRAVRDQTLTEVERALMAQVLFDARAISRGGFSRDSFGGFDMNSACEVISLGGDIVLAYRGDHARPVIYSSDEDVLEEANAIYLHGTALKWLDVGTFASATKLGLCAGTFDQDVQTDIGGTGATEVAKDIIMMRQWWIERTSAIAGKPWSHYTAEDRAEIWDAFTADQHTEGTGSSMESYAKQLDGYRQSKVAAYRASALTALQLVFPDGHPLSAEQRSIVEQAIAKDLSFGAFTTNIAVALDTAQSTSNGPATQAWNSSLATRVQTLGGGYADADPVRPADQQAVDDMRQHVMNWLADRYRGYPIDIQSVFTRFTVTVTTENNATTNVSTGNIRFGVGTKRSLMEYYSLLLHEIRHAVAYALRATAADKAKIASDEGTAVEGSGVAAEELLREPFLRNLLKDDLSYALYALDFGVRDARFVATTDATLQKYLRACSPPANVDTVEASRQVAKQYGLTGVLADNLALRVHAGTQYFQYISAGVQVLSDLAFLQDRVDPSKATLVDPYLLFVCGLNTPARDDAYVGKLKACVAARGPH
jgi:hypothetical protein